MALQKTLFPSNAPNGQWWHNTVKCSFHIREGQWCLAQCLDTSNILKEWDSSLLLLLPTNRTFTENISFTLKCKMAVCNKGNKKFISVSWLLLIVTNNTADVNFCVGDTVVKYRGVTWWMYRSWRQVDKRGIHHIIVKFGEGWWCVVSIKLRRFYPREADIVSNEWADKWTPAQGSITSLPSLD